MERSSAASPRFSQVSKASRSGRWCCIAKASVSSFWQVSEIGLVSLRLEFSRGLFISRPLSAIAAASAPPSAAARSLHPSSERARPQRHRPTPTRHRAPAAERWGPGGQWSTFTAVKNYFVYFVKGVEVIALAAGSEGVGVVYNVSAGIKLPHFCRF